MDKKKNKKTCHYRLKVQSCSLNCTHQVLTGHKLLGIATLLSQY